MTIEATELRNLRRKETLLARFVPRYRERVAMESVPLPLRIVLPHCVQSDDGALLYVKNSKVACTSISQEVYRYSRGEFGDGRVHSIRDGFRQGKESWRSQLKTIEDHSAFIFSFVRHPEDRFLSAVKDVVIDRTNPNSDSVLKGMRRHGYRDHQSDEEKLEAALSAVEATFAIDKIMTEQHFRSQVDHIGFNHLAFDFIGRFEALSRDLALAFAKAGAAEFAAEMAAPAHANASKKRALKPNAEQRRRIEALYQEDFDAFGYDFRSRRTGQ
ncbi:MAG: sulfotransferase family 2 domain-containing protein [Pseudomonadota bacterium]